MNTLGRLGLTLALGTSLSLIALAGPGDKNAAACSMNQAVAAQPSTSEIRLVNQTATDVIKAFVEAVNKGDAKAARAMFADNGFAAYGMSGSPKRGADLDAWMQSEIFGVKGKIENAQYKLEGNQVTLSGKYVSSGWSGNANYVFTVEGGKITAWNLL